MELNCACGHFTTSHRGLTLSNGLYSRILLDIDTCSSMEVPVINENEPRGSLMVVSGVLNLAYFVKSSLL